MRQRWEWVPERADAANSSDEQVAAMAVFRTWDWVAFLSLSALGIVALTGFFAAWFSIGSGQHPVIFVLLTGVAAAILINQQGRWFLLLPMRRPAAMPAPRPAVQRVAVVTTHVPLAEPAQMIEATLRAMVAIEYPHDTWLLDEGDDPAIIACCHRLGVRHFSRRSQPAYRTDDGPFRTDTKHGNYNAWLDEIGFRQYDIMVAFDPDHVPKRCYLDAVLGYFRDPRVGYVQTAQAYYNQSVSLVAGGAAEETYAYFSAVQMAGYGMGYPIIVGGHNAHRMTALEAMGGLAAHDADDLLLTLRYRAAGWEGVYVPRILARGLTPVDWRGYLGQQRRWARSVLDLKFHHRGPYAASLPLRTRVISLLHGVNFLHRSVAYGICMGVLVYLLATGQTLDLLGSAMIAPMIALCGALGAQELYRQRFYLDWRSEHGLHWRAAVLGFAKWPWFLLALVEAIGRRRLRYAITWKLPNGGPHWAFVAWNVGLVTVIAGAWTAGTLGGPQDPTITAIASAVVAASTALALSGLRSPAEPYTPGIWQPAQGAQRAETSIAARAK